MAEFKIGRLRFTWAGAWATGTFYNRDAVASYNGKTYVCLVPHTSGDFYVDFTFVTEAGASTPYWTLMLDGHAWKQSWTPNTYYSLGDIITYGGVVYTCIDHHTSGASVIDLTKWATYSSFDNWHTGWNINTAYGIGDIVKYGGIVYRCTANHVSAGTTSEGLEFNQSSWTIVNNGIEYKGAWSSLAYRYRAQDIVKNGPDLWICGSGHTSSTTFDQTKWTIWMPGEEFAGTWNSNSIYQPGDVVMYGGYSYYSKTANNTNNIPSTDATDWALQTVGYQMMDEWNGGTAYKIGSVVRRSGQLYSAVQDNSSQDPALYSFTTNYILSGSAGTSIVVKSIAGVTTGMIVLGNGFTKGQTVVSTLTANAVTPTVTSATVTPTATGNGGEFTITVSDATGIVLGMNVLGTGIDPAAVVTLVASNIVTLSAVNTGFVSGQMTIGANAVIVSSASGIAVNMSATGTNIPSSTNVTSVVGTTIILSANTSGVVSGTGKFGIPTVILNTPAETTVVDLDLISFVGVNYLYWTLVVPGTTWSNFWADSISYVIGDLTIWKNTTYRCVQNHISSKVTNRPDLDTSSSFWTIYVLHARNNALNTAGDIVTYNNGVTSLPITTNNGTTSTQDYVLKSLNKQPSWSQINTTTSVYYVAANGVDSPAPVRGLTIDKPWASIAYACQQVAKGTANPNTSYLISTNKDFIVAEMYQWMLYQKANNTSPFTTNSTFSQTKTYQDAGYFVDAIIYDITRGGNSQIVANTLAYFKPGTTDTFINATVASEMPYFIAALNYLSGLILTITSNSPPSTNYQVVNNVYASFTTTATATDSATETITVGSVSLMTVNQAIVFSGSAFGNLVSGNTYYIKTIDASGPIKKITVSSTLSLGVAGPVFNVVDGTGALTATGTGTRLFQNINTNYGSEGSVTLTISTLSNITISALTNQTTTGVPQSNAGTTATIFVKTGTYFETLPITIPENTAIVGDELRGTVIQPKLVVNTVVSNTSATTNLFTVNTTDGMIDGTPVQFAAFDLINTTISGVVTGGVTAGQTYYVIGDSITSTQFSVSDTIGSSTPVTLIDGTTKIFVYGGDAVKNMFYARNGSGLRNCTMLGLLGTLTPQNQYFTQRPTGGAYLSLDPGTGPDDTSAWIFRRSPYAQNCTMFGQGCVGMKVDGSLHNGGNKSIVANDFTTILSDGIGAWITNSGAVSELVSVFAYYSYAGYFAENGGRVRATNGNTSYGSYGCIAEGYDNSETPISATVYNRVYQASASVQSSFGNNAQLLKLQYSNAGSNYTTNTTNLLNYSNNFLTGWTTDSNILLQKNLISPSGYSDGWTMTGTSGTPNSSYIYQSATINPTGAVYLALSGSNLSGSGSAATFDVTVGATAFSVIVTSGAGGSGYVVGNQLKIFGSQLGGTDGLNDVTITVTELSGSAITNVSSSGTVPTGSALNYTFSMHVKKGTASSIDLQAIYSGSSTVSSGVTFNFSTTTLTPTNATGGLLPSQYGIIPLTNNWYRIWFTAYDTTALNNSVQFRIYPKGTGGVTNTYSSFYGAQCEIGGSPNFYLTTTTGRYTAYADYIVNGAGTGAIIVADEVRSNSIFQSRVTTDSNGTTGGAGYLTASNNAQGGTPGYIVLAGSDIGSATNYTGMRLFVNSGTGAGQYGFISYFNPANKFAYMLKESFTPLTITATNADTGNLTLSNSSDINSLYINQPVQFIPTYYTTSVTATSEDTIQILSTTGGTVNYLTVGSTSKLAVNMEVSFTGATFGGVVQNYTYFITSIIDTNNFQISTELYGTTWLLNTATGAMSMNIPAGTNYLTATTTNMLINMPVQFTGTALGGVTNGTLYYINDVISQSAFTISGALVTATISASDSSTKQLTVDDTTNLVELNPIQFAGTSFGNIASATKYYISKKIDGTHFTISTSLLSVSVASTASGSNLITLLSGSTTAGFIANNPIVFVGKNLGGIIAERIYYILAVNDSTSFTVSNVANGSSITLSTASGFMTAKTAPSSFAPSTASGTMAATSTRAKSVLTSSTGNMSALFSTPIYGNVTQGTTYYIMAITPGASNTIQITSTINGNVATTLATASGSMQMGMAGWDHINAGTPSANSLDSTSMYYIEPRLTFTSPSFSQVTSTMPTMASLTPYVAVAYGKNYWIAIPSGNSTIAGSADGSVWTAITLPAQNTTWTDIAYGNSYWVIISQDGSITDTGSKVLYSASNGAGWRVTYLPSKATWTSVTYGNGIFVALSSGGTSAAYSNNFGGTWSAATLPSSGTWSSVTWGGGKFVAIASGGTAGAYSIDGQTWTAMTLPSSTTWTRVVYGNGRFVAISASSASPAISFDGITWYSSPYLITVDKISYGQGVFVAVSSISSTAYTSEDGLQWTTKNVSSDGYGDIAFGFIANTNVGAFVTVAGTSKGSIISAGCQTKGRPTVTSGKIISISHWEPGSGYGSNPAPSVSFFDPNVTTNATTLTRVSNGTLGAPTFINRGIGYNTNSTVITINGNGYADEYQVGLPLNVNNLTLAPRPGDNLVITDDPKVYKVTNVTILNGSVAPNITATIQISPEMTTLKSPANGTSLIIRQKYSQVRLTGHDFLNVGFGNVKQSNYPGVPADGEALLSANQAIESNYGRVFYTSTDQDGNFLVGLLFGVQQATGIVTLSATQFGLTGLDKLSLGGISVGGSGVVVSQFSTDQTFVANSNTIIPTQRAIKGYLTSRLSQGGSNTFTGQTTAGTVVIGGPDKIGNTIPQGTTGSSVKIPTKVYFGGTLGDSSGKVDGNMMAQQFFIKHWLHR